MTMAMTTTTSPRSLPDAVELPLQRVSIRRVSLSAAGDAPHLGVHAGSGNDRAPRP